MKGITMNNIEKKIISSIAKFQAQCTIFSEKTLKKKNTYIFIGRRDGCFSGNTKYLYLYFLKNISKTISFYLTQNRETSIQLMNAGLPVLYFPSDKAFKILAEAGTIIVESISYRNMLYYPLVSNARQIQLWHGVGNKKIGFLLVGVESLKGLDDDLIRDHSNFDLVVSTSPFYTEEVFKKSLHAKEFVSLGYPRTDIFYSSITKEALCGCDIESFKKIRIARKDGPIVLFSPTFRDTDINPITQNVLDFDKLINIISKYNAHLVIKPHPRVQIATGNMPENVTFCNPTSDIYPFLKYIDVMITDYSSIYTEYLLIDRPIIFFWADYDHYMAVDRGFQFPFDEMCPGPKCRTGRQLLNELESALLGIDEWKEERKKLRNKAFLYQDGKSAQRIADYLLKKDFDIKKENSNEN
jgi:CDP-glycerol glycerophosphotransferase (TagB/SpsB family)